MLIKYYRKHHIIYHSHNDKKYFLARGKNHINGIESFWSFTKRRLNKFNGTHRKYFYLHLKESEWRFNLRNENIYDILLSELRKKPLKSGSKVY